MPTFEVDDQLHGHPKAFAAGLEALGLWTMLGSWCMAYLTDGRVPRGLPLVVPRESLVQSLIKAGLLEVLPDGDYQMHDWLHWQKPASWWHAYRAKDATKKRNSRAAARALSKCPQGTPSGTPPEDSPGESHRSPSPSPSPSDLKIQRKGSGKPPKSQTRSKPETPIPADFAPSDATRAFATLHGRRIEGIVDELRVWSDLGNTSKDWQARLRQFVLNAEKRGEHAIGGQVVQGRFASREAEPYHAPPVPTHISKAMQRAAEIDRQCAEELRRGGVLAERALRAKLEGIGRVMP